MIGRKIRRQGYAHQKSAVITSDSLDGLKLMQLLHKWLKRKDVNETRLCIMDYKQLEDRHWLVRFNAVVPMRLGSNVLIDDKLEKHEVKMWTYNYYKRFIDKSKDIEKQLKEKTEKMVDDLLETNEDMNKMDEEKKIDNLN